MDSPSSKNLSEVKVKKEEEIELPKKDDGNEVNYEKVEKKKIERSKRIRNMAIHSTEEKRLKYNKKTKTKADELSPLSGANTRRAALKKVIAAKQAKQTKVTASKKILKKIIRKKGE